MFDINIHVHAPPETLDLLRSIHASQQTILANQETIMANEADLSARIDELVQNNSDLSTLIEGALATSQEQTARIEALLAELANNAANGLSAEQLQAAVGRLEGVRDAQQELEGRLTPTPPVE